VRTAGRPRVSSEYHNKNLQTSAAARGPRPAAACAGLIDRSRAGSDAPIYE
jgi:hypothetical protein